MIVTPLTEEQVESVVQLHQQVLGDTFNARVGTWFLTYLYKQLLARPQLASVFVAQDNGQLVGFISVAKDYHLLSSQLMASLSWKQKLTIGRFLLVHPTLWMMFVQQRMFGRYLERHLPRPVNYILTLGVAANQQGKGVGRLLMDTVKTELSTHAATELYLDTKLNNAIARRFYERYGFQNVQKRFGNVLFKLTLQ